jgi:hypothetical protein
MGCPAQGIATAWMETGPDPAKIGWQAAPRQEGAFLRMHRFMAGGKLFQRLNQNGTNLAINTA